MGRRIVVLGAGIAGLTAALELEKRLGREHEITVISRSAELVFLPSLIWVPFGLREKNEIAFPVAPLLVSKKIAYQNAEVDEIDLNARTVTTSHGSYGYDFLVIAIGAKVDWKIVPGIGSNGGHTQSVLSWQDAERARFAWDEFLDEPGPVVIGALQGSSVFSAAYEFAFNAAYQLRKRKLLDRAPISFLTAEPYLGHLGVGGFGRASKAIEELFDRSGIAWVTNARVAEVTRDEVVLADARRYPFRYAMLIPPYRGLDVVREHADIVDDEGFVKVDGFYRTFAHPEVFAAGVAVSMPKSGETPVPCGAPKTGYASEEMARVVAHNIAALIHGDPLIELPPAAIDAKQVLDAGDSGLILTSDRQLEPREHAWIIPGPEAHWAKVAFEKWFLASRKRGHV